MLFHALEDNEGEEEGGRGEEELRGDWKDVLSPSKWRFDEVMTKAFSCNCIESLGFGVSGIDEIFVRRLMVICKFIFTNCGFSAQNV